MLACPFMQEMDTADRLAKIEGDLAWIRSTLERFLPLIEKITKSRLFGLSAPSSFPRR